MLLVLTIVTGSITLHVPAAKRVNNVGSGHLRVEYDDVVQFSDLVVASVSNKYFSKIPPKCIKIETLRLMVANITLWLIFFAALHSGLRSGKRTSRVNPSWYAWVLKFRQLGLRHYDNLSRVGQNRFS